MPENSCKRPKTSFSDLLGVDITILDLKEFNKQYNIIKKNIILYSVDKLFGTTKGIEKIHIDDIIKLCLNNIGNKFLTPNQFLKIVIKNKKIYIIRLS